MEKNLFLRVGRLILAIILMAASIYMSFVLSVEVGSDVLSLLFLLAAVLAGIMVYYALESLEKELECMTGMEIIFLVFTAIKDFLTVPEEVEYESDELLVFENPHTGDIFTLYSDLVYDDDNYYYIDDDYETTAIPKNWLR